MILFLRVIQLKVNFSISLETLAANMKIVKYNLKGLKLRNIEEAIVKAIYIVFHTLHTIVLIGPILSLSQRNFISSHSSQILVLIVTLLIFKTT